MRPVSGSVVRRAAGAGTQAAGFAALRSYVWQVATAEPAERLAEAKRQPITNTSGSRGGALTLL